jgi:hypothetical protein
MPDHDFIEAVIEVLDQYEIRKLKHRIAEILCAMAFAFSLGLAMHR